ncbi:MAG: type II toxin-antitoxin system HicA family toxin [Candidatus Bathyarchaeia archaeon]
MTHLSSLVFCRRRTQKSPLPQLRWYHGTVIKALYKIHFVRTRQRGRHVVLTKKSLPPFIVPLHEEIKKGTLGHIINRAGITKEEFLRLLKDCLESILGIDFEGLNKRFENELSGVRS